MSTARLREDPERSLQELIRDYTELDMNADPEVDHIKDPSHRERAASAWLDSRQRQLGFAEGEALLQLHHAQTAGFLDAGETGKVMVKYQEAFERLEEQARAKYREAVSLETTAQASG